MRDTPLLQKRGENHDPWGKCTNAAEFARGEVEKIDGGLMQTHPAPLRETPLSYKREGKTTHLGVNARMLRNLHAENQRRLTGALQISGTFKVWL